MGACFVMFIVHCICNEVVSVRELGRLPSISLKTSDIDAKITYTRPRRTSTSDGHTPV